MKYPFLIVLCLITMHLRAQTTSTQDSISTFYNELFSAFKIGYLHKKTVNWPSIETETKENLKRYNSFKKSLNEIRILFDKLDARHCLIFDQKERYSATLKTLPKEAYNEQWKKKYDTKPVFEAKVLEGNFGYILMPGMVFFDTSAENIHQIAQPLYDQIADIKTKNQPEGWIIDLRFNTGGNVAPMLLALYDFLGDNTIWGTLNLNKKFESKAKLKKGQYLQDSKIVPYIHPKGALLDQTKVAVITGVLTGSSGEVTALAFKGRPNTRFFGETTSGFTTGNVFWPLPFGITMALTTSYDSDRNGNYYERIVPDVAISKQDNFDDLFLDKNIQEAIRFIRHPS